MMTDAKPIYLGIDPAFRSGGFVGCLLDMQAKTADFIRFRDLLHFHDWLRSDESPAFCFLCVENSNLQNQSFDMSGNRQEVARKSRNAGCNQAVSQLAYQSALDHYGPDNVFQVSPKEKGKKITDLKIFEAIARQDGVLLPNRPLSQDERDAYHLAFIARRKALSSGAFSK